MARCCLSKSGYFSAAHVISMGRKEKRPNRPKQFMRLPKEGDIIIYNIRVPFGDKRTDIRREQRGCIRILKIYPSIIKAVSYQIIEHSKEEIYKPITLQINDFRCGNVLYVKVAKPVYSNTFEYEDWQLQDADNMEGMIARLHPYLKEISIAL